MPSLWLLLSIQPSPTNAIGVDISMGRRKFLIFFVVVISLLSAVEPISAQDITVATKTPRPTATAVPTAIPTPGEVTEGQFTSDTQGWSISWDPFRWVATVDYTDELFLKTPGKAKNAPKFKIGGLCRGLSIDECFEDNATINRTNSTVLLGADGGELAGTSANFRWQVVVLNYGYPEIHYEAMKMLESGYVLYIQGWVDGRPGSEDTFNKVIVKTANELWDSLEGERAS